MAADTSFDIPVVLNDYRMYYGTGTDLSMVRANANVKLPSIESMTETVKGGGILGEIEAPVAGHFGSMEAEIGFITLHQDAFSSADFRTMTDLLFMGAQLRFDSKTGLPKMVGIKVQLRGWVKKMDLGSLESGTKGDPSAVFEISYIQIVMDGKEQLLLDKLNHKFSIGGKDMLEDISKFINA